MDALEDAAATSANALAALARVTRRVEDPRDVYPALGSLSAAAGALSQCLHQIASLHDQRPPGAQVVGGSTREGRAAGHEVSWELHRAGQIVAQAARAIDHAHEIEATIGYPPHTLRSVDAGREPAGRGVGL